MYDPACPASNRRCKRLVPAVPGGVPRLGRAVGPHDARFHLRVAGRQIGSIPNFRAQLNMTFVEKNRLRNGTDYAGRRVAHQPAQHLTPKHLMTHVRAGWSICQRQSPPLANTAVRPRPYFSVINKGTCDRPRSFQPAPKRPAWECPLPEIHQIGKFLPARDVGVRVLFNPADQAVAARRGQLHVAGSRWNVFL